MGQKPNNFVSVNVCRWHEGDMVGNSTVDKVGKKTILLKTTGHEKRRYTVALAYMVDGQKLSTGHPTESIGDASAHTPGHLQGLGAVPGDL